MPLPTLPDLKSHLNIPTNDAANDAELMDFLAAAVNVVEGIVGPLQGSAVTETHYGVASRALVLRRAPVVDLSAVTIRPSSTWAADVLAGTDLLLDSEIGVVTLASGRWFRGDVTVTYAAGQLDVAPAINLAVLIIAAQLWESQRGAMPLPANAGDDDYAANVHFAPAIPNRAKTLLEPYARGPAVA